LPQVNAPQFRRTQVDLVLCETDVDLNVASPVGVPPTASIPSSAPRVRFPRPLGLVLFDHAINDWRDVIRHKINVPAAIFSGEESNNLPSQRWAQSVIPNATLFAYTSAEQGDHFLMFKNPIKFTGDLRSFLER
jgi:pimeloyl-ACP methyl ester carboxylesterase